MAAKFITQLTPEQEALIPHYQQKWQQFALSTEPINRQQVLAAVRAAYAIARQPMPEVIFCGNPIEASDLAVNLPPEKRK